MNRTALAAMTALAATPVTVGSGAAQTSTAPPQPGCAGLNGTDERGDSPRADTDLLDAFLRADDGRVTLSVRLAALDEGARPGLFGLSRVYVYYSVAGKPFYMAATMDTDSARFEHGPRGGGPRKDLGGTVHRGSPLVVTFRMPDAPSDAIQVEFVAAAPGVDVPDDDRAGGSTQSAACPPPPPMAQPPAPPATAPAPAPAAPRVKLRRWSRGFVVGVTPATRGTIELLRNGRRVKSVAATAATTRIRLRARGGSYRERLRPAEPGAAPALSAPLRVRS